MPRGKSPKTSENKKPHLTPEQNAETIENAMWASSLEPVSKDDAKGMADRINLYLQHCIDHHVIPGMEGMCNAMGTTRRMMYQWISGEKFCPQDTREVLIRAKQVLADLTEQYMMNGYVNPITSIFVLSNNYGYIQKTQVSLDAQPDNALDHASTKELADRYHVDALDDKSTGDADVIDVETKVVAEKELD